jgi:hypothetical protein
MRRRLPNWPGGKIAFARWFSVTVWRACLRRVLQVDEAAACLAELPAEQQRLLQLLYVDQQTFQQAADTLRRDAPELARCGRQIDAGEVRRLSRQAYQALRSRIASRLGEGNDGFPLFPAAAGQGL